LKKKLKLAGCNVRLLPQSILGVFLRLNINAHEKDFLPAIAVHYNIGLCASGYCGSAV
jgi:hypothetical protein